MLWKTFLGRCIHHSSTGVRVFDNLFFRWLQFDSDALQTVLNKAHPHKASLYYIKALVFAVQQSPGNCCILGLGGAGAAHAIAPYIDNFTITAVEYNSDVIKLAPLFFMTDIIPNFKIIHQEAYDFVSNNTAYFQHVIVDLFDAHSFPETCYNDDFFAHCKRLLLPTGVLAVNLANKKEQFPVLQMIKTHFSLSTIVIPVEKCANLIILACNLDYIGPLLETFKRSKRVRHLYWDSDWGYTAELR